MFNFLKRLFSEGSARAHVNGHENDRVRYADGTEISYRPQLVEELKRDHRQLEFSFGALVAAHREGDFDACVDKLKRFTSILRAHLLKENLHLYVYLKHALRSDSEATALMNSMRIEMQHIGKTLNAFATEYVSSPWDEAKRYQLGIDLHKIAGVLKQRIATEESTLYPLYMPPDRY